MREVKFRGIYKGHLVYGNLINGFHDGVPFTQIENSDSEDFAQYQVKPETVGQYTGLKDKNGVEIYEGDICKTYQLGIGGIIQSVVFDNGSFCLTHPMELQFELRGFKTDYIEVIGNVHQNPELL